MNPSYVSPTAQGRPWPQGWAIPRLGNKPDPTDELVYILLARHTREGAYQQALDLLKKHFPSWNDLLDAPKERSKRWLALGAFRQSVQPPQTFW